MAKKSKKRVGRHDKDQAGCMWSLMNIFDFRHVRSSQKLLLDRKRGSKRLDGAVLANIELESLSDSCHVCNESKETVQNETSPIDTSKMSVKELMMEEMCGEQDKEQEGTISSECEKLNVVDDKRPIKKNRRWTRSKMSLDLEADGFVVAGDLVEIERPIHRKHKSCSSVDLNEVVEELCSQIQQKDREISVKQVGDSPVVEKQLAEAAKVLVKHFTNGRTGTNERKVQPSKELTDALQMLNSNKEVFLKLLQDPNSQLVKHLQNLQDIHVEEGKFKVLTGSDLLDQDIGTAKQPNFFWRNFKGSERNSSRKSDTTPVDLSRIVLLKPGTPSTKNLDMASNRSSLPESPKTVKEKDEIQKPSFPFTFAEFMRKLKHVMRKEQRAMSHQPSEMQSNLGNRDTKVGGEPIAMASPSRDHFFIERIPRSSVSFRNMDKTGKVKDSKIQMEHEQGLTPEQRVSNIYIEAKRHLAEIVGNNDVDVVDTHGRKVPKSLGGILSYAGYNSPTICSPRPCVDEKSSSDMQQINDAHPNQLKQEPENEPCVPSDKPVFEEEIPTMESCTDSLRRQSDVDIPIHKSELPCPEDITRVLDVASQKESNLLEVSVESCSVHDIIKTEHVDCCVCSEENTHQYTSEEYEHSSCPDSSTLNCSFSGKIDDLDAISDATSRPSPISVLEPLFNEDDISPPGIKNFTATEPIRPRQIKFEEKISAPIGRVPSSISSVDFDKYTLEFVRDVVQMSGLSWDELLTRSIFSDHFINPSLIDEVDFLPDNLPCDFNLLFEIINEVVIELCWLNCGCMLSLAIPFAQLSPKGKPIFDEVWKVVSWYLAFEGPTRTLDQIIGKDFANPVVWGDSRLDCENIGIQIQEAILDELVEDTISDCFLGSLEEEVIVES
ncbi:uncharacterized protein LOC141586093 [Silene latifolia]|uniref:uncharacterized protein LOC141586093 n=1 Tax=Silene latifolia TaxID=37657 RepID=UPI003D773D9B